MLVTLQGGQRESSSNPNTLTYKASMNLGDSFCTTGSLLVPTHHCAAPVKTSTGYNFPEPYYQRLLPMLARNVVKFLTFSTILSVLVLGVSETASAKTASTIDARIDDVGSILEFRIGFLFGEKSVGFCKSVWLPVSILKFRIGSASSMGGGLIAATMFADTISNPQR